MLRDNLASRTIQLRKANNLPFHRALQDQDKILGKPKSNTYTLGVDILGANPGAEGASLVKNFP